MSTKLAAFGYTFLWSFVYGFIVSCMFCLILTIMLPEPASLNDTKSMKDAGRVALFALLAAAFTQLWLVFGKAYDYGYINGKLTCKTFKTPAEVALPVVVPTTVPMGVPP